MARTYSFDHFKANNPEAQAAKGPHKPPRVTESGPPSDTKVHYGRRFAQTEELIAAHAMNDQMEKLAGIEPPERKTTPLLLEAQPPQKAASAPIGAISGATAMPEPERLGDLLDETGQQLKLVRGAIADLGRAGIRLASLPWRVAKLATRWLSPAEA